MLGRNRLLIVGAWVLVLMLAESVASLQLLLIVATLCGTVRHTAWPNSVKGLCECLAPAGFSSALSRVTP